MATKLGIDATVVRLLMDCAILCSQLGRYEQARSIGQALAAFRDDLPQPPTLIGMSHLWQGQLPQATAVLEATLKRFPNAQLARAFLAVAWRDSGRAGADALLRQVIDDGRDEWALRFARQALGYDYRGAAPRSPAAAVPAAVSAIPAATAAPARAFYG